MIRFLFTLILGALGTVAALAARQPARFRLERSITIAAPPERVFGLINDLQAFNGWNPFAHMEPNLTQRYGDTTVGVGAFNAWEGRKIGSGSMLITHSETPVLVRMKLDFVKPIKAQNTAEFLLQEEGAHTRVTWAMEGVASFFHRAIDVVINRERMTGSAFEQGLVKLKDLAERQA